MTYLPIYFKLPNYLRDEVGVWLLQGGMLESTSYNWITGALAFEFEADAAAFSLKFGLRPVKTTLSKMIENAESID